MGKNFNFIYMVILIPLAINLYTLKYLYDIRQNETCDKLNSPYLQIFFDMYITELLLSCFLILYMRYVFNNIMNNKSKFDFKKVDYYTGFFSKNKNVVELFGLFVSGIMIKMLYDIKNEPICKDIDISMRESLYYGNIIGSIFTVISILKG